MCTGCSISCYTAYLTFFPFAAPSWTATHVSRLLAESWLSMVLLFILATCRLPADLTKQKTPLACDLRSVQIIEYAFAVN
jgi:hypothetical protein